MFTRLVESEPVNQEVSRRYDTSLYKVSVFTSNVKWLFRNLSRLMERMVFYNIRRIREK